MKQPLFSTSYAPRDGESTLDGIEDWKQIGDRRGWLTCLEDHCVELKGHRVIWRKDADPYRLQLLKSAQRQRTL